VEVCPNRANIQIYDDNFRDKNQILHLDYLCNECGNCTTFCPFDGAPYKDKFTLFGNEKDFGESDNNGFVFTQKNTLKIRTNNGEFTANINENGKIIATLKDKNILIFINQVFNNYNYLILGE
jgi:putative selenate reductase